MLTTFLALTLFACGTDVADSADPCATIMHVECPPECPEDYASSCGEACDIEGEACGNEIGDGRVCTDGVWTCSVHSPLEPGECNIVCER